MKKKRNINLVIPGYVIEPGLMEEFKKAIAPYDADVVLTSFIHQMIKGELKLIPINQNQDTKHG
jgi:hypothetical protein